LAAVRLSLTGERALLPATWPFAAFVLTGAVLAEAVLADVFSEGVLSADLFLADGVRAAVVLTAAFTT